MLKQTAVWWPLGSEESGGVDFDDYGQPTASTPVEIKCRWEDKAEEFIDAKNARCFSKSVVYVDRDVVVSGYLMLGELSDVTDEANPRNNIGAFEIKGFSKIPNLRATEFLRTAFL